ncbi:restriction endonuclease [Streptomyces bobili]|uniref:hypothetical protein n=1 Tax=Streptomyces TaxID=1883 RepID=UPI002255B4CA|nr:MULTISPECIES: hypothetical protein [Streptomyces]MCX5521383.1 restriction endonuclease [Streptomyces bobili]MDX3573350.1 hypothetical protein [Streptomyces sp. ID05-47C]
MAGKLIGKGPLRGYLLEEVLAWLLRSSGFEVLTADDDKDKEPWKVLKEDKNGLLVRGRGAWHQVDALGQFRYVPPFSLPVRLFVEAKYLTTTAVGLPTVRNGHGVIHDVNEGETTTLTAPGTGRPRTRYRYNYAIFSTSGFSPEAQDYALAHQISLIDLSAPDFAVLRNLVRTTADTIHAALEMTPAAERPQVREIRAYLRGPLLEMDADDVDLSDTFRVPLDYLAQTLHSRSRLGLVLAFPAAPFVLGLASDDLYAFVDYAKAHPTHAVRLRRIDQTASHPVWELRPAEHPEAYALRCGLPERVEAWIVEQDEGMPARTRYIKRSMLSTMTLYWMDGEHAQTFQLRYEPGELRFAG